MTSFSLVLLLLLGSVLPVTSHSFRPEIPLQSEEHVMDINGANLETQSLLSIKSVHASPDAVTSKFIVTRKVVYVKMSVELVKRLRALTLTLIPVELDPKDLIIPTSRIISPRVITKFQQAAGDYEEAVSRPFLHLSSGS